MQAHERAKQISPILTYAALHSQTLTYTILGKLIGVPARAFANLLSPIQSYCLIQQLPALTSLVVDKNGKPSIGFIADKDVPAAQSRVFEHDWLEQQIPSADDLLQAHIERPSCGIPEAANDPT